MLGFEGGATDAGWSWVEGALKPGQVLGTVEPLFTKLDEALIEEELQRIGQSAQAQGVRA